MEMFRRMFIFRGIAAANMPTDHAFAEMYPGVTHFQAFLTALRAWMYILNLIKMRAVLRHYIFPFCVINIDHKQPWNQLYDSR